MDSLYLQGLRFYDVLRETHYGEPINRTNLTALEPGDGLPMAQALALEAMKDSIAKEFDRHIALLKRRQNASLLIFRLPVELLVTIFQHVLPSYEDVLRTMQYPTSLSRPIPYPTFIRRLISVCHRWRKIILDSPALWTVIPCDDRLHLRHATVALRLSRQMPLDVAFTVGHGYIWTMNESFKTLPQESSRWRRLAVNCDGDLSYLEFLETRSAPELEDCRLYLDRVTAGENAMRPLNIFNGKPLPKLRTFGLVGIPICWEFGQLAGGALRSLYLYGIGRHAPSVAQILDIVHLSPLLETLSLDRVALVTGNDADLPNVQPPSITKVHLQNLPSAALRQLVPRIRPTLRCARFLVENTPTPQQAPDFFAPGHESVLESILRGRDGKRICVEYREGMIEVNNGHFSFLRIRGPAADRALQWVRNCLASPTGTASGEVRLGISYLKDCPFGPLTQTLRTLCSFPNVVELNLYARPRGWEAEANLVGLLSRPVHDAVSGKEYWALSQLQFITLNGSPSIIPTVTQMVRARLGLENTPGPQILLRPYPAPLKKVSVWSELDSTEPLDEAEFNDLKDIVEKGCSGVYWRFKVAEGYSL